MAIPIKFLTVIVRCDDLDTYYRGGRRAYWQRHRGYVTDTYFQGIVFMSRDGADKEVEHLMANGMPHERFAVVDQSIGLLEPRDWIVLGEDEGEPVAWLKDECVPPDDDAYDWEGNKLTPKNSTWTIFMVRDAALPQGHPFKDTRTHPFGMGFDKSEPIEDRPPAPEKGDDRSKSE